MKTRSQLTKFISTMPAKVSCNNDVPRIVSDCDNEKLSEEGKALIQVMTVKLEEIIRKIDVRDEKIQNLEQDILTLNRDNRKLRERVEDIEAYGRANTFILSGTGLPESSVGENCSSVVCELVKQKLRKELSPNDISVAYRLGKKISQGPDKRRLLVKMSRKDTRDELVMACRTMKPVGVYLNEDLTPERANLLYIMRQAKRKCPQKVAACGSQNGQVYVWMKAPNPSAKNQKIIIGDREKLVEICEQSLGLKMSDLVSHPSEQ